MCPRHSTIVLLIKEKVHKSCRHMTAFYCSEVIDISLASLSGPLIKEHSCAVYSLCLCYAAVTLISLHKTLLELLFTDINKYMTIVIQNNSLLRTDLTDVYMCV